MQSLVTNLGVTEKEPFFTFNDTKIFALYDPPHLIKSIRLVNLFLSDCCILDRRNRNKLTSKAVYCSYTATQHIYEIPPFTIYVWNLKNTQQIFTFSVCNYSLQLFPLYKNVKEHFEKKIDGASNSVVNMSAGKGSCTVWSVFDPRSNHRFFKSQSDSQRASSLKQSKSQTKIDFLNMIFCF